MQDLVEAKFSIGNIVNISSLISEVLYLTLTRFLQTQKNGITLYQKILDQIKSTFLSFVCRERRGFYIAYVSEQNLLDDVANGAANHPDIRMIFSHFDGKSYIPHEIATN